MHQIKGQSLPGIAISKNKGPKTETSSRCSRNMRKPRVTEGQ